MAYIGKVPTAVPLSSADLEDNIITSAKIVDGTIATADISDGAVTSVKTTGVGGTNTPAFEAIRNSNQTGISNETLTKAQLDIEVFDTDSCYDNSTNYRFTPNVAGKYLVYGQIMGFNGSSNVNNFASIIYKNGSAYRESEIDFFGNQGAGGTAGMISTIIEMNGTTDYVELFGYVSRADAGSVTFTFSNRTRGLVFGAYKIIE